MRMIFPVLILTILLISSHTSLAQDASWSELNSKALELGRKGEYYESVVAGKEELELAKKKFGPHHENVITSLKTLVGIFTERRDYAKAEPLLKKIVAIRIFSVGDSVSDRDYIAAAGSMRDLAALTPPREITQGSRGCSRRPS